MDLLNALQGEGGIGAIARELGVDAIVEGTIQQSGGRVKISAELVRAATQEHLWGQSYERTLEDALALEDDVAGAIAHELRGALALTAKGAPTWSESTLSRAWNDLVELGSVVAARGAGKARMEGKDYVMQDGDVVEFRFNV